MSDELSTYARQRAPSPQRTAALISSLEHARRSRAPRSLGWKWGGLALACAAAAATLVIASPSEPTTTTRSLGVPLATTADSPHVQLRLAVERDSGAVLLERGELVSVGERVFFQVSTDGPGEVTLWSEGPEGRQRLSQFTTTAGKIVDVPSGGGLLAWRFESPGLYRFWVVSGEGDCPSERCDSQSVEVE